VSSGNGGREGGREGGLLVPIYSRRLVNPEGARPITHGAHLRPDLRPLRLLEGPHRILAIRTIKRHALDLRKDLGTARDHPHDTHEFVEVGLTQEAEGEDDLVPDDADVDFVAEHGFVMLVVLEDDFVSDLVEDLREEGREGGVGQKKKSGSRHVDAILTGSTRRTGW